MRKYTIQLTCDLCTTPIGSVEVSEQFGWTEQTATERLYRAAHGLIDNRCTPCETIHGNFKSMCEDYIRETGHPWKTAEIFVLTTKKKGVFDENLAKIKEKIKQDKEKLI